MCGCTVSAPEKRHVDLGAVLLELDNISTHAGSRMGLKEICLSVRAGEIVGVAGVSGNGQTELGDMVAGVARHPPKAG